jgi:hypothetical protein
MHSPSRRSPGVSSPLSPSPACLPALPALFSFSGFNQSGLAVQGRAVQNNGRPWCCSSVIRCVFSPNPPLSAFPPCLPSLLHRFHSFKLPCLREEQAESLQQCPVCLLLAPLPLPCLPLPVLGWLLKLFCRLNNPENCAACFLCLLAFETLL